MFNEKEKKDFVVGFKNVLEDSSLCLLGIVVVWVDFKKIWCIVLFSGNVLFKGEWDVDGYVDCFWVVVLGWWVSICVVGGGIIMF